MGEPFVTNVLSNKYDTALDFHVTMYDKLPYERDSDYCNVEKVALNSGKVIKYFLYMNQPGVVMIDNKDEEFEQYLLELQLKYQKQKALNGATSSTSNPPSDEVTDEQIQTLLDDQEENVPVSFEEEDSEEDISLENTTNPFADVEDW